MRRLVTGDVHISQNPRDAYRLVFLEKTLPDLIDRHKVEQLLVLGDLTQAKEKHPASLVNSVVGAFHQLSKQCEIVLLQGNHDYQSVGSPFFEFLSCFENNNPDLSLGGAKSTTPITSSRLFSDVTSQQTTSGLIDYRCIYVTNTNNVDFLYRSNIFVSYTVPGDVTALVGFIFNDDQQNITITNASAITGGNFTIVYSDNTGNNYPLVISWNSDLTIWANELQTAINTIPYLSDVTVSADYSGSSVIFEINFLGDASDRYHNLMILQNNALISSSTITISIEKIINGSPINSTADVIDVGTTTPNGVTFGGTATVGDIRAEDFVPVWIQRTVPAGSSAIENDGFTLSVSGDAN